MGVERMADVQEQKEYPSLYHQTPSFVRQTSHAPLGPDNASKLTHTLVSHAVCRSLQPDSAKLHAGCRDLVSGTPLGKELGIENVTVWLNETLYTTSSAEAKEIFEEDATLASAYHEGHTLQTYDLQGGRSMHKVMSSTEAFGRNVQNGRGIRWMT
eukprot:4405807-Amphidinium_carterae.1